MDGVDGVVVAPGKVRGYQPQGRMEKDAAAADPATVDTAWRAGSSSRQRPRASGPYGRKGTFSFLFRWQPLECKRANLQIV